MIEILSIFAVLVAAPFCIGLLPALAMPGEETAWSRSKNVCPAAIYVAGLLVELAVFQLIAVPVIIYKPWGFPRLVLLYSVLLAVLSAAGLVAGFPVLRGLYLDLRALLTMKKWPGIETCIYWVLAAGLVLFQMYMAFTRSFFDGDDAYYVAQSVITEQTDILYRILPYTGSSTLLDWRHALAALPVWEAYLARVSGMHPAVVAHSLIPLVFIPATYLLYFRIGMRLFRGDGRKNAIFMILVSLLQIFGNTSIYTNATFFLMRTWQGKSLLCNLVLLAVVWILLRMWDEGWKRKDGESHSQAGWWILLCANNTVASMATTMGGFLVGLLIAVIGLVIAVREKRPGILPGLAACCIPCLVYLAIYAYIMM